MISQTRFKSLRIARSWAYHNGTRQRNLGRGSYRHIQAWFIACLYPSCSCVSICAMRRAWVMSLHRSGHTYTTCADINKYPGLPPSFIFTKNYSLMGWFYILCIVSSNGFATCRWLVRHIYKAVYILQL